MLWAYQILQHQFWTARFFLAHITFYIYIPRKQSAPMRLYGYRKYTLQWCFRHYLPQYAPKNVGVKQGSLDRLQSFSSKLNGIDIFQRFFLFIVNYMVRLPSMVPVYYGYTWSWLNDGSSVLWLYMELTERWFVFVWYLCLIVEITKQDVVLCDSIQLNDK